jgi:hypothetical protein
MSFVFWLGLAGGSLGFLMLQHLVLGRWALVIQRPLEAAARTMSLLFVLFLPLLLGMDHLYAWTDVEKVAHDAILSAKQAYLNKPFFLLRAAFYFTCWVLLSLLLTRWSRKQDETGDAGYALKIKRLSGGGLVLYGLTVTFASFDWMMSLEPHWFSSVYGALFMVGQGLSALALMAIVLRGLAERDPLKRLAGPQQFHDVGNLLFAFVILWTYMGFGQFLIIWSGNLHEETFWYLDRRHGGWLAVSFVLFIANFLIPFFLLLVKSNKRRREVLTKIAWWILVTRFIDIHWHIAPTFHERFHLHALDFTLPIAIGGFWVAAFIRHLNTAPHVAASDPRYKKLFGANEESAP